MAENKVQELYEKATTFERNFNRKYGKDAPKISWHFIGNLQSNKINKLLEVPNLEMIHSIDNLSIAKKLNKKLSQKKRKLAVLVQVNTSQETAKHGCRPQDTLALIRELALEKNINVRGLMTIGKLNASKKETKECFRCLRKLKEEIASKNIANITLDYLSMGMSSDYEIAIEEGSNMIRIGSKIFTKA